MNSPFSPPDSVNYLKDAKQTLKELLKLNFRKLFMAYLNAFRLEQLPRMLSYALQNIVVLYMKHTYLPPCIVYIIMLFCQNLFPLK